MSFVSKFMFLSLSLASTPAFSQEAASSAPTSSPAVVPAAVPVAAPAVDPQQELIKTQQALIEAQQKLLEERAANVKASSTATPASAVTKVEAPREPAPLYLLNAGTGLGAKMFIASQNRLEVMTVQAALGVKIVGNLRLNVSAAFDKVTEQRYENVVIPFMQNGVSRGSYSQYQLLKREGTGVGGEVGLEWKFGESMFVFGSYKLSKVEFDDGLGTKQNMSFTSIGLGNEWTFTKGDDIYVRWEWLNVSKSSHFNEIGGMLLLSNVSVGMKF